ncbi:putative hydrolase of the HAD superfamily [Aquisalibacillus elongatus]|uniref:Putative hydrolase of the HAD superfamily n=2 Tax=Aquisalibacillus elongatus TaxID=485577 RepID=A0A3N5C005_9BACI|nr:putative hydrolase of the HAD superfamily [Aquisalibacillus elongatus]
MIYKAMLFDLDDTLLNRDQAVENMFFILIEKCYEDIKRSAKIEMLQKFKEYDKKAYGDGDKAKVFEAFFDEFPTEYRLSSHDIQDFWNNNFPNCFSINQKTINTLNTIKKHVKVAIITNGSTQRQRAKIIKTNLDRYFETIIISEEVGLIKPDKHIFDLALDKLNVKPEEALFVGDDMEKDIGGCQNANINGIWFNPYNTNNTTDIKPYDEINSFDRLISYFT